MEGDAARPTGRRGSRKPRVNYLELLGGVVPENADPNTPAERSHRKPRAQRQQHAAPREGDNEPEEQPQQPKQPRGSKRKAAQRQQQRQQEAVPSAEAAEAADDRQEQQQQQQEDRDEDADYSPAAEPAAAQPRKQKRQRVLVDVHRTSAAAAEPDPEDAENEYERARLERIRRNQEMLKQMGIQQMAQDLATTAQQQHEGVGGLRQSRPKERRERAPALPVQPSRKSARMRGLDPSAAEEGGPQQLDLSAASEKEAEQGQLLELEEYFQLIGQDVSGALVVDGRYHGWVNPEVCERYGLAGNADEAWEGNGGGKFSFKINKKDIPAHLRAKGWSDARAFASTQLKKNPNSYFYRHVAPHEQQAQGEWTEEEHELFMSTARANGVGDKWGLFASYIPQRVGYQCSAYYRDVVIPQGLVIDKRFKITHSGKAVFVG